MKLYIIRHGETKLNALGRLQGWTDEPLNQNGKDLAIITGEALKEIPFDLVITSPLKRARETAEIINKQFNVEIIEDDRLMERCYGDLEGITKVELKEKKIQYPEIDDACNYLKNIDIFNMETIQDLCARIYECLDEITTKYKDENILIVTHGSSSIPIKCYFMKYPLENLVDREKIKGLENCEVVEFEI